jgi:hypothetical protein
LELKFTRLQRVDDPFRRAELLRSQTGPRIRVVQQIHLIMLPADVPPQLERAFFERDAGHGNDHHQNQCTAEAEKHRKSSHSLCEECSVFSFQPERMRQICRFNRGESIYIPSVTEDSRLLFFLLSTEN